MYEFSINDDNIEPMIEWKAKHLRWEHALKKHVEKIIKSLYLSGTNLQDYRLMKIKSKRKDEKINMNSCNGNAGAAVDRMMQTKHVEILKIKYEKGNTNNACDKYNYPITQYHNHFNIINDDLSNNEIRLSKPFGTLVISDMENRQMINYDQFGGGNYNENFKRK